MVRYALLSQITHHERGFEKFGCITMNISETDAPIFIVTGFSGAGKTVVLRALEDYGFLCVDNLPSALLSSFFQFIRQPHMSGKKVAIGIDIRSGQDMQAIVHEIMSWRRDWEEGFLKIIFINAGIEVLLKRFQETRRKHPLGDNYSLADALEKERMILEPLRASADLVIDTDQLTMHQLRALIRSMVTGGENKIMVTLTSFGFKYGVPSESNFVYDIRSLPNPYFVPELKHLDGRDVKLQEFLFSKPEVQEYWQRFVDFLTFSLRQSHQEGRFFVHVAIGCTGGRHRSVAFVDALSRLDIPHVQFFTKHRDMHREQI